MTAVSVELSHLADLGVTSTPVTSSLRNVRCDVVLNEEGGGTVTVPYGKTLPFDPAVDGAVVTVSLDTNPVWSFVIEQRDQPHVSRGETAKSPTIYTGRGLGSLLDRYRVLPSLGAGRSPWGLTRTFSAFSPEYDFSGWAAVTAYATVDDPTNPKYGFPDGFPAGNASWIGPTEGDETQAPYGYWWTQTDFTLVEDSWVRFFYVVDDYGPLMVDGFQVIAVSTDRDPLSGFTKAHTADLYMSAGTHRIGAKVVNNFGDGDPGYGEGATVLGNPTMIACVGYLCDQLGQLGDVVVKSDATWKHVAYLDNPPGMTELEVIETIAAECVALGVAPSFTVTGHGSWTPLESVTVRVGSSLLAHIRDRADAGYLDWITSVEAYELHIYAPGVFGSASGVEFVSGSSSLRDLNSTLRDNRTDALLVAYQGGYVLEPPEGGERVGFLESKAATVGEAKARAAAYLALPSQPEQVEVGVRSVTGSVPGVDFTVGDTVDCGSFIGQKVIGWSVGFSASFPTEPTVGVTLLDRIRSREEAFDLMVARSQPGALGGSAPSAPAQEPPEFGTKNDPRAFQFSIQPADGETTVPTGMVPATEYPTTNGNLYAFDIGATDLVGDITIDLYIGAFNVGTGTLTDSDPNGVITAYLDSYQTVYLTGGVSGARIDITSAPTSVASFTVTGRVV